MLPVLWAISLSLPYFRERMSIVGNLDGFNSHQLAADMPPKASWEGWLTARHIGRAQEEAQQILQCWLEGSRACWWPSHSFPAGSTLKFSFNTSLLHQQKFAFFLLPECRQEVVEMFVASLFKCLCPADGNQNQNKQVNEYPVQPLGPCRLAEEMNVVLS